MRRDIRLRTEPTARESNAILARIESELTARGAGVQTRGIGTLLIKTPSFWRLTPKAFRLGSLLFISSGKVTVSSGSGGPRRVRYELDFLSLQIAGLLAGIGVLSIGLSWRRVTLAAALVAIWVVMNLLPRFFAARSMHRLVYKSVEPIVDRRQAPRTDPPPPDGAPPAALPEAGPSPSGGPPLGSA